MAATPKKKVTRARGGKRRAGSYRLTLPNLVPCPNCKKLKLPHYICPNCGAHHEAKN